MQYDFNLNPNGSQQIEVKGKFFKYKSGIGNIRVRESGGDFIDLSPGQGVWNRNYSSLSVQDLSGNLNTGILIAGDFDFRDDTIVGSVEVVDGGKNRTRAGNAYFCYGTRTVGTAGNRPIIQLFNPANSGKIVYVKSVLFSTNTTQFIGMTLGNTQVGTLISKSRNKKISSVDGVTEVRAHEQIAYLGTYNYFLSVCTQNGMVQYTFQEPIMIDMGFGIGVNGSDTSLNNTLTASFEIIEE